jgi:hypothetical protein
MNKQNIELQLGDIIEIIDPTNEQLNKQIFIIDYLDSNLMKITNTEMLTTISLPISNEKILGSGTIQQIILLSRDKSKGYAKQNQLIPGTWIEIHFGGDVPAIITGEITNLEEDMIEISTYPEEDIIYINFDYKGIPLDLPIENIVIREKPEKKKQDFDKKEEEVVVNVTNANINLDQDQDYDDDLEEGEIRETTRESVKEPIREKELIREKEEPIRESVNIRNQIRELILKADQVQFGNEEFGPVIQYKNVDEKKQRYSIETQTNDLLDELLSTIPNQKRTNSVLNNIHTMIERFKQLRNQFSIFDEYGNVTTAFTRKFDYKPLEKYFQSFQKNLYWILPVVKNIKKIYSLKTDIFSNETNDTISISFQDDIKNILSILDNYKSKNNNDEQNKYSTLYNELNPYFTPFDYISSENQENILLEKTVDTNINIIINNLEDFYSSVYSKNEIVTKKFLMQKYNLGLQQLENIGLSGSGSATNNRNQIIVNLTNPDTMSLDSFIMLPEPIIRYSRINLPGTSILERSTLNQMGGLNYWELFKKSFSLNTIIVDTLDREIEFNETNFANQSKQFVLGLYSEEEYKKKKQSKEEIYTKFIQTIIPKTKVLFQLMKKYIHGKLSVIEVVKYLEPFLIYTEDITYQQYVDITQFIYEKISEFNKKYLEKSKEFLNFKRKKEYKNATPMNATNVFSLSELLEDNTKNHFRDETLNDYEIIHVKTNFIDNSEILRKMLLKDGSKLFTSVITIQNMPLMFPSQIDIIFEKEKEENEKNLKTSINSDKCKKIIVAKLYYSENELQADNNKDIYYDKKYDKTNYAILDEYEKDMISREPEDFVAFLTKKLKEKYHLADDVEAENLADTLIHGFKRVQNGEHAILYERAKEPSFYTYFIRKDNQWVKDDTVSQEYLQSVNSDDSGILCDLQKSCIQKVDKFTTENYNNNNCESIEVNKLQLKESILNQIMNEFDETYTSNREDFEVAIKERFDYYSNTFFPKLIKIEKANLLKYNNQQYELGLKIENEDNQNPGRLESPFRPIRDILLGQQDFVKKQNDIIRFVEMFCRKSIPNSISASTGIRESEHWLYCIKTNVELLPVFYYELACAFTNTPDEYYLFLQKLIAQIGVLSEDGDAWTDKFTGREICKIDYSFEEGYEESGFRTSTRAILEEDAGNRLLTSPTINKYDTVEMKIINNIVNTLSVTMGVTIENQKDFIISGVLDSLKTHLEKEETYKKRVKEMANKGTATGNIPSYPELYNTTLLFFTLGMFLIAVQTNVPSIRTRKTFPGCVRSFSGFPFEGTGDNSSLHYLSCIVYAIRKNSADPWTSIKNTKETAIATKIKNAIDLLLLLPSVKTKIDEKTAYLLLNPGDQEIPGEHDVSLLWTDFLPPLVSFKLSKIINISAEFESSLLNDLKNGNSNQRDKILVLESKNILFSLAIQEKIQAILNKKDMLLNKLNNEPYLENACCNENSQTKETCLQYFENTDSTITNYNKFVVNLSNILMDIRFYSEAKLFYSNINTKKIFPSLNQAFDEKTIYLGFIHFCRFNSLIPIDDDLLPLCTDKPTYINKNESLNEMIQKLKNDGRNYTDAMFLRLLQVISRKNIIPISDVFQPSLKSSIHRLTDALEFIETENDEIVEKSLRDLMVNTLDTFNIATERITDETKMLNNFLIKHTETMKRELMDFIIQNKGATTKKEERQMISFIENFSDWKIETSNSSTSKKTISNEGTYTIIQFYKNIIQDVVSTFPNIILNQVDYADVSIPAYWGLSQKHSKDIKQNIADFYQCLRNYYDDATVINLLKTIQITSKNFILLAKETPSFTSINYKDKNLKPVFDERTSKLLFEYYLLRVFINYIDLSEEEAMITKEKPVEMQVDDLFSVEYLNDKERRVNYTVDQREEKDLVLLRGNVKQLKQKSAKILLCFIKMIQSYKETVDISYQDIQDRIFKLKEKEKNMITDRLEFNITDEEREADTILKINKLGVWSKGLEKGLRSYVKENYDKEKEFMDTMMEYEKKVGSSKTNLEDFEDNKDDYLEQIQQEEEIDREAYDMSHMTEDYMDGNEYEGYEVEEEDYEDYN